MKPTKILIVDDDPLLRQTLQQQLLALGYGPCSAPSGAAGEKMLQEESCSLVLLDLRLPDANGIELLKRWKEQQSQIAVIMMSGQGTIPEAVEALKYGAADFLVKPVDLQLLRAVVKRTLDAANLQQENSRLRQLSVMEKAEFLGRSPAVTQLLAEAGKIAPSDHPVFLEGETGTGKQILARHIHACSGRSEEPFISLNCAAITQSLFESELFGHEKGAFTGAYVRKAGKLELVGTGTLFLDEVGELPPACQAKLLTVVEDRTFERVGGNRPLVFEGRIIAATNRQIEKEMESGGFRRDLFYRLSTLRLKLPPLRSRPEDIPIYIEMALERCRKSYGRRFDLPTEETLRQLSAYPWPGNVRELVHHVERTALLSDSPRIPQRLWLSFPVSPSFQTALAGADLASALWSFKKQHVLEVLAKCGGNQTAAAEQLGIGRTYLNRLLARLQGENENNAS